MAIQMGKLAASSGSGSSSYASIAQALEKISDGEMQCLRRKFEVGYVITAEKLRFLCHFGKEAWGGYWIMLL